MARGERWPRLASLPRPLLLLAIAIGLTQLYLLELPHLTADGVFVGGLLFPLGYFGLFLLFVRAERRPLADFGFFIPRPIVGSLAVGLFLLVVATVLLLEPGFGYGFLSLGRPTVRSFGYTLAVAPLTALGVEALFRGYVFQRLLAPRQLAAAIGISATGYALAETNLTVLGDLPGRTLGSYLLTNTATAFGLGVVLAFYFYRSGRSLFGPFVLRTGMLLVAGLFPLVAFTGGWLITFLDELVVDGALLVLIIAVVREPRTVARRYLGERFGPRRDRFLGTLRRRRTLRDTVVTVAAIGAVVVSVAVGVEAGLGTAHPFLAIETGSMVPVLHRGDLVVLRHVPAAQIGVGSIVAYSTTCLPSPVVHRVVGVQTTANGTVYTTKGDANPSADPCPVPYASVLGKVVAIVPYVGFFVLTPALAVGTIAAAVLVGMLISPGDGGRFPRRRGIP